MVHIAAIAGLPKGVLLFFLQITQCGETHKCHCPMLWRMQLQKWRASWVWGSFWGVSFFSSSSSFPLAQIKMSDMRKYNYILWKLEKLGWGESEIQQETFFPAEHDVLSLLGKDKSSILFLSVYLDGIQAWQVTQETKKKGGVGMQE